LLLEKEKKTLVVFLFVDNIMGNRKSAPNMIGIAAISSKRSVQSVNLFRNVSVTDEQAKKWILAERDIDFLHTQTGKYKYLFCPNFIKS
jgi:hypothetical protein